jgi:uncharacterized protein with PIN domain
MTMDEASIIPDQTPWTAPRQGAPGPRFLVDQNVASLARRLRWLGYDAADDPAADDPALVARAGRERRMLLTRDRGILRRQPVAAGAVAALWLVSDDPWQQLAQVVRETGIDAERYAFSRCVRCNVPLEAVAREVAVAAVPPFVGRTQEHFTRCPRCGRFYWRGTHWQRMRVQLQAHVAPSTRTNATEHAHERISE